MLRIISCQQATLHIERQADDALSATERNSLWLHLRYCPFCTRYAQQSLLLSQLVKAAAARPAQLPAEARHRLHQRLSTALEKDAGEL
jgi:hypothetical protein